MSRAAFDLVPPPCERRLSATAWPLVAAHRDGLALCLLLLCLAAIWIGVPLLAWLRELEEPIPGLGPAGSLVAAVVGLGFALWGLEALTRRLDVAIDDGWVAVRRRRLGAVRSWHVPLADYAGVLWRSQKIRDHPFGRELHLVVLSHRDPGRALTLASSIDRTRALEDCRILSEALGLEQLVEEAPSASGRCRPAPQGGMLRRARVPAIRRSAGSPTAAPTGRSSPSGTRRRSPACS